MKLTVDRLTGKNPFMLDAYAYDLESTRNWINGSIFTMDWTEFWYVLALVLLVRLNQVRLLFSPESPCKLVKPFLRTIRAP